MQLKTLSIVIPTYRRVSRQKTYDSLPEVLQRQTTLVVSKDEVVALQQRCPLAKIVSVPDTINSISAKRAWIIHNAATRKVIMLDDDMDFYARSEVTQRYWDGDMWKPNAGSSLLNKGNATSTTVVAAFKLVESMLDSYPHGGLGSRMGNHLVQEEVTHTGRMMHAIAYDTHVAKKAVIFNRVRVREDFDYTLQLLRKGYNNFILHSLIVAPGSYGAIGGASEERTTESSDRDAELLAELHPGFVSVVQKDYKGIPRKEVIVRWKAAYASAKKTVGRVKLLKKISRD